jgi:hypothetical protein
MAMKVYRLSEGTEVFDPGSWTVADGTSPYDKNQAGGPFLTGTIQSGPGVVQAGDQKIVFTVTGGGLTPHAWANYSITNTTRGARGGVHPGIPSHNLYQTGTYICDNDATTFTCVYGSQVSGTECDFNAGNGFAVNKVNVVMDAPGQGKDNAPFTGNPPLNPVHWPQQDVEGCFGWNNTQKIGNASPVGLPWNHDNSLSPLREGTDFFNRAPTTRDLIITKYGAYTPYTYPHPLVSGRLGAPGNLRVVN